MTTKIIFERESKIAPIEVFKAKIIEARLPAFVPEYQFCSDRDWKIDIAFVDEGVMCEVEGGVYRVAGSRACGACGEYPTGRHTRGDGFTNDTEKYNITQAFGLELYRFTTAHVLSDYAIELLKWRFNPNIQFIKDSDPLEFTLALHELVLKLKDLRAVKRKRKPKGKTTWKRSKKVTEQLKRK